MKFIPSGYSKPTALILLLIFASIAKAQLKIGDQPSQIQKSSILELESTRQGLLLPRLSDTVAINALNPPDGMIIYLNSDNSLRVRSNGSWKNLNAAATVAGWALGGNSGTAQNHFIGTTDGQPLVFKTNNAERLRIDANGNMGVGVVTPTAKLDVGGSVKFRDVSSGTDQLDVLVLHADGTVMKRTMSSSVFGASLTALNNMQKQSFTISASASLTDNQVGVTNIASDSTISILIPVQDGSSGQKQYGLLTIADWQKINSSIQSVSVTNVASGGHAQGATATKTSSNIELTLHPATATTPGIITNGSQELGGNKTFAGKSAFGMTGEANSSLQVGGSISMAIKTVTSNYSITADDNTILVNAATQPITVYLPSTAGIAGRIYTIKKIAGGLDNDLTIQPTSATIDDGSSFKIYNDWTVVTLQTDGSNWYVIRK